MAFSQAQLDALEAAIAQGSRRVKYADKEVEYRDLDEMMQLRNTMRAELGTVAKSTGRVFCAFSKGV